MSYAAWRIGFQSSEQAALAAYQRLIEESERSRRLAVELERLRAAHEEVRR